MAKKFRDKLKEINEHLKNVPGNMIVVSPRDLVGADWNYKLEDQEMEGKLEANIERNGQIVNVVVRELDGGKFEVVDGNHRLDAMEDMEFLFCWNLGKVSKAEAIRTSIELNETKFVADKIELGDRIALIMSDLELDPEDLEVTMPYTSGEISSMVELSNPDFQPSGPVLKEKPNGDRVLWSDLFGCKTVSPKLADLVDLNISNFIDKGYIGPDEREKFLHYATVALSKAPESLLSAIKEQIAEQED